MIHKMKFIIVINSIIYIGIFDRSKKKTGINHSINHNFARIRIDSYNSL